MLDEPGPEEGGEDVFGVPAKCIFWKCIQKDAKVVAGEEFHECENCGSSYGPVNEE